MSRQVCDKCMLPFIEGECGCKIEEQDKPVAWMIEHEEEWGVSTEKDPIKRSIPLYTHPLREVTDEELFDCLREIDPEAKRLPLGLNLLVRAMFKKAQS